jgi:SAM-dependent methyltransferase
MTASPLDSYRSLLDSTALRSAWAEGYGERFWPDSEPPLSEATKDDAEFVLERLAVGPQSVVADLGCGSGCFGRYAATAAGCRVDGIDFNALAIGVGEERAARAGQSDRVRFTQGDIACTGWASASFDGAASLDVLLLIDDKAGALAEAFRILKPGGRFAGTTWEFRKASPTVPAPEFTDYPAALRHAGFEIELYEEAPDWRGVMERALSALVGREAEIRAQVLPPAADRVMSWAKTRPSELDDSHRVRFCARRPSV